MHASTDAIDSLVHQAVHLAIAHRDSESALRALARAMREVAEARRVLAACEATENVGGMAHGLARLDAAHARLAAAVRAWGGSAGSGATN